MRITCINIRNGAKMELNNLSATIYADTYRSQRETNFEEYLRTLYSSNDYTEMLEATVAGGLAEKIPLSTEDYEVSDISLEFNVVGDRVEYISPQRTMRYPTSAWSSMWWATGWSTSSIVMWSSMCACSGTVTPPSPNGWS